MDFAHDGKISESEFMRATGHYRRLGKLLTINTWENIRRGDGVLILLNLYLKI